MESTADEVLYGGAAGGGKSHAQVIDTMLYATKYPRSRQVIFRENFRELEDSIISLWLKIVPNTLFKYNGTLHTATFPNGSIVYFRFMGSIEDMYSYQGAEYDVIRFDELTLFQEEVYVFMMSRLRGDMPYPRAMKSTTNPGNIGHYWVKKRFIDPMPPNTEVTVDSIVEMDGKKVEMKSRRIFIPAKVTDNEVVMKNNPLYIAQLYAQGGNKRKALLYGEWDLSEGQYFTEWNPDIHVIQPFPIPADWEIYRALDYGLDMLACYWIAMDFQGRAYVFREVYEPGLIISDAAKRIIENSPEDVFMTMAPPDLWNRNRDTGKSFFDLFWDNGIVLDKASNDRAMGWANLLEWLKPFEDETGKKIAGLRIFNTCRNLIRTLPMLQPDKRNPNDVARNPHELTHAPDALRYFVAGRPSPAQLIEDSRTNGSQSTSEFDSFLRYGR